MFLGKYFMKFKFSVFILFIIISVDLNAQNIELPSYVDLLQYKNYDLPKFRIWGWSRDGKMAYSRELWRDDTDTCYNICFYIFDFINDENILTINIDTDKENSVILAYIANLESIRKTMEYYKIIENERQIDLLQFPIRKNNILYESKVTWVSAGYHTHFNEDTGEWWSMEFDEYYNVDIIISRNNQTKIINTYKGITPGGIGYSIEVGGYLLSPFENRALIFIFHGSMNLDNYDLSGCHLDIGFR